MSDEFDESEPQVSQESLAASKTVEGTVTEPWNAFLPELLLIVIVSETKFVILDTDCVSMQWT